MEDGYLNIKESIEKITEGQIQKRRKKLIIPIICIIIGIVSCIFGLLQWNKIGYEQSSYVLVFAGLFVVGGAIVLISANSYYYVYIRTGEIVKPQNIYIDPDKVEVVKQLLKDGDLESVLGHQIKKNSPLMLQIWRVDGHKLLYSQLLHNSALRKTPLSDVYVTPK